MLSVQLVANDLVVGAHPSLNSRSHGILRDFPSKGLQVLLQDTETEMKKILSDIYKTFGAAIYEEKQRHTLDGSCS